MACKILPIDDRYVDFLTDESCIAGQAQTISFPENEADVRQVIESLSKQSTPITIQGSRTGITGSAVPVCGHILNLSRMDRITGLSMDKKNRVSIHVQPGLHLARLHQQVSEKRMATAGWDTDSCDAFERFKEAGRFFWPPDPSERTASIGGIAATNARGICGLHYGSARHHITGIRVVDACADVHSIKRGQYCLSNGICPLPGKDELKLDTGGLEPAMDLVDLYLGSEGLLGVITGLELALEPMPVEIWGIVFFFSTQSQSMDFIQTLTSGPINTPGANMVAMEFMDHMTLKNIQQFKLNSHSLAGLPNMDPETDSAVCLIIHGHDRETIEALLEKIMSLASAVGGDPDNTWAFCNENEMERFHLFRHAAPESSNLLIHAVRRTDPRISKLGTDMQLKSDSASKLISMYQQDLDSHGLIAAVFGHAGDGLFHVNIVPADFPQYLTAKTLMEKWAQYITKEGGSAVTEHGIGKIKPHLFRSLPLPGQMACVLKLKEKLDPKGIWNPGNIRCL